MATETWTPAPLPDLTGRTAVVTGASSGLGMVTARELARAGARVVLAVRDPAKGRTVAAAIAGDTEVRELDLANLASVRDFAAAWSGPLDLLVNNAGIMAVPPGRTADGFELHIGTNHLGHFALTNLLLPRITDRIVTVSSGLSRIGRIHLADLNWQQRRYQPMRAYGQSKLANLLFTLELNRRLTQSGGRVRALSAHPGVAATPLDRHIGGLQGVVTRAGYRFTAQRQPEYGALPTLYAATQDLPGDSYIGPGGRSGERPRVERRTARDSDVVAARRLWELSEDLTGVRYDHAAGNS
ncbi:oxidoreductase [Streptantibioticus ferralitis]|uniref:Oxidoreductase n=1 Tax=Streptantibioticus ferralitis TaxID=236510 RepID=A0ABT5YVG2_9ACTN|nr:oxidoreductase [Streptantibioticus ferralitis]MDF2255576.1 oxidoreductase [Streptantibioticus ferralitis]